MSTNPKTQNTKPPGKPMDVAVRPEVVKPGWGALPAGELPLRPRLAQFSAATRHKLVRNQSGQSVQVGGWLFARAEDYFRREGEQAPEHLVSDCMATAMLDLLVWQSGGLPDREALERLPEDHELQWELRKKEKGKIDGFTRAALVRGAVNQNKKKQAEL